MCETLLEEIALCRGNWWEHKVGVVVDAICDLAYQTKDLGHFDKSKPVLRAVGINYGNTKFVVDELIDRIRTTDFQDSKKLATALLYLVYPSNNSHADCGKKDDKAKSDDHYPYIKFNTKNFVRDMDKISRALPQNEVRFIDVGCGDGEKLVLAHAYVRNIVSATGVEYTPHTYHLGLAALERADFTGLSKRPTYLLNDDAFNLDYSAWNFIYMYCPIRSYTKMQELHRHILKTMPVGGVMVEMLPEQSNPLIDEFDMKRCLSHHLNPWVVRRTESGYETN